MRKKGRKNRGKLRKVEEKRGKRGKRGRRSPKGSENSELGIHSGIEYHYGNPSPSILDHMKQHNDSFCCSMGGEMGIAEEN